MKKIEVIWNCKHCNRNIKYIWDEIDKFVFKSDIRMLCEKCGRETQCFCFSKKDNKYFLRNVDKFISQKEIDILLSVEEKYKKIYKIF